MLLQMKKGQEHGLVITPNIKEKSNIMYAAYSQALEAVKEIARQARKFYAQQHEEEWARKHYAQQYGGEKAQLYSYAHNIIAFSGSRGQGKTSAMLSFSKALAEEKVKEELGGCSFTLLEPIDPTVLEKNQGILAVILSRMYHLAEKHWQEACADQNSSFRHSHTEAERNAILDCFQRCLSSITAVKFRKGEEIKSLQIVHEISDSALLKESFYRLTEQLLRFTSRGSNGAHASELPFLVIQLDDTDFQIQKAYEILDDIRKYLTIPNVIILMATDMDLLRHTLAQHYLEEFGTGLKYKTIDIGEVRKLESKYLDKLIPPTFAVYLPHIDDLIRQQETLQIDYQDPDQPDRGNLLLPQGCPCKAAGFSFQALILRYIYRQTHIIFAEPDNHIHNLIPTTLRGLSQFLGLLASMREVKEVDLDSIFPPDEDARKQPVEKARESAKRLAQSVLDESEALEWNLRLFEDYFLYDWAHTKLPKAEGDIIEQLSRTMPGERCRAAILALRAYKQLKGEGEEAPEPAGYGYSALVEELEKRKGQNRLLTEFYFTFAIQTFFSIQFHKTVLRQKRRAAQAFLEDDSPENSLLLFDFTPGKMELPWVYDDLPMNSELLVPLRRGEYISLCEKIGIKENEALTQSLSRRKKNFNPMKFLATFLVLGSERGKLLALGAPLQKDIYLIQTSMVNIAINWDVQEKFRRFLTERFLDNERSRPYKEVLASFLTEADELVKGINKASGAANTDKSCPMVSTYLKNVLNFTLYSETRSPLGHLFRNVYESVGQDYRDALHTVMESADQLKGAADLSQARDEWNNFLKTLQAVGLYNVLQDRWKKSQDALSRIEESLFDSDPHAMDVARAAFIRTVDLQLAALYESFGYTAKDIEEYTTPEHKT